MCDILEKAIELLKIGKPIFIYDFDNREQEVDIVIKADVITPELINWIRINAGGLICFVTTYEIGKLLGIDLMTNYLRNNGLGKLVKKPCYGDEPAFSIWVNHVNVKTGIRDIDKALTIKRLAEVVKFITHGEIDRARVIFYEEFYSPGHVPILLGRIGRRFGHTELSLILAKIANIEPALIICEFLNTSIDIPSKDYVCKLAKSINSIVIDGVKIIEEAKKLGVIN